MASLLNWLGKRAKAVEAQLNPFDNGQTYNTVVNNQKPTPRPQVQQPQIQRPQQPGPSFIDRVGSTITKPLQQPISNLANSLFSQQELQRMQNNPSEIVKTAASKAINPTNIVRANPLTAGSLITNAVGKKLGITPVDSTKAVDTGFKKLNESSIGKNRVVKFTANSIAKPVADSFARYSDVSSGQQRYADGMKGAGQLGTDAFNIGSTLYTPVKAGVLAKGGAEAWRAVPGALARGFGAASGINVVNQLGEGKKLNQISLPEAGLSGLVGAGANILPGVAGVAGRTIKGGATKLLRNLNVKPLNQAGFIELGRTPKKIHPEDQNVMSDFIDYQRGIYKPRPNEAHRLEIDASRIAERYGLNMPPTAEGLADEFDNVLSRNRFGLKKLNQGGYVQLPGGKDVDPLESLKQEALKYKSAEEFLDNTWNRGLPTEDTVKFLDNTPDAKAWYKLLDEQKKSELIARKALSDMEAMRKKYVGKKNLKLTDAEKKSIDKQYNELAKTVQNHLDNYGGFNTNTGYVDGKGLLIESSTFDGATNAQKQLTDLYNQATQSQPPKSTPVQKVERNGKPLAPKVEVPTGFAKSLEDAGFSTPQRRAGHNKVQADSPRNQVHTPNQSQSASMGQPLKTVESPVSYRKEMPETAQSKTPKSGKSQQQSGLSSSRSSDNIIDLESIDVNDPFGNRSLIQKVKNEFNRMFIDEDAEMISLLRKVEKETGSKDMVEKWLQDTDMVRGSNSIANSKVRNNENLKGAIHGLSKKEVKELDEYASARSELYNLENGLSASKSKEKLQSIINKHEAKYGKRFESLNNYYNDLAKDLHEAGIISKQQLDTWAKNKDYVRVQRDMEDLLEPSVGKSRSRSFGSTSTSKKRTGSKRDILSPTETAFKRTQEIQLEIQRNKAASNIIDVLEKHGLSERIPQSQAHGKNVIKRFRDGKVEYFATNKDIKRVIENVRPFELGVIAKVVSFPTRVFKAGTTGLSAPFAVTNYARDQVGSAIYSKSVMATHNPKNIVSGIYQGVKDFGGVGNSDIWEKFVKHGGDQTSFDMTRGTLGSKSIMNEVRRGSLKQRGITLVDPRYLVRNVEDLISITEKSTRYQNFKGIYEKAIKEGLGEDVAIQKATQAALQNSVNFGRAGSVAKVANLILPYFNAGIQGSRNLARSFRDRPVATSAKSVGFVGIPMVALTLHNYSDPETREIYSNIDETEKQDNFIIVLPGAKQRDDGTYEGILKIPKPQGYRELLDPLRSYAESFASGEDPKDVASMLNDMLPAISGPIQTEDMGKFMSSLTPQVLKPALQAHLNKDLYWGSDTVPDYMIAGTDDPTERARKNTSGMARFIANRLGVSPIQVEKFIVDSTGSLGRYGINAVDSELAKRGLIPEEQIGGKSIKDDFKRRTTEARGIENKNMTDGQRYFRDREEVTKSLKPQQKTAWESYNQSNKNFKGEVVFDKSSFAQKQAKASAYVQFPELFETDKKLDKKARDRGEPGNPLYDLNYKQAIKVVLKKALPPGSKDSELDALYNQPWYADFKAKESQYYDKIFAGKEKEDSGYPQRSPELQKKLDYYYTLPKGTGDRSRFLDNNPDIIKHWDAVEAWTNGERAKIGLDPTTKDDSFGFGSGGGRKGSGGGGRRGRSKAGYDYAKALFDANVGAVSMSKDLQSILQKYMKAAPKISKKA